MTFEEIYRQVRPVVLKLRRKYHLHIWDNDDWEQEGMISLYELLKKHPELCLDKLKLLRFFKTKFSNYVNDEIRRQESQKRQFNKPNYEEIGDVEHSLSSRETLIDDFIVFKDSVTQLSQLLSKEELIMFDALLVGERFKGRAAFIRKLKLIGKKFF
ncbi:sigma-70 family RNA polymerase sigma factor [Streptococcus pacificus]|uniref:Sigma-70 family RNA polymerase sigma factor n=1 Tax=Streptococcus pacificus TaxID=2740577 RepID=A0ABS0ZKP0_9STRE|nr:sigma-70 family RNA polymerase sigma factor [Streptococcus pacificus]MBJ8326116.1 sigma-70 family RNA polymerase sigma factor [Streptococcus pacificus]